MATETKTDVIQLRVTVDGSQGRKELAETQQAVQKLRTEQERLREQERKLRAEREAAKASGNTAELKRLNTELAANRTALGEVTKAIAENATKQSELRKEIGITALTLGELRKKAMELRSALASSTEGSATYKKLEAELVEVEQRMGNLGSAAQRQMRVWEEFRKTLQVTQMTVQQLGLEEKRLEQLMAHPDLGLEERAALNRELLVIKQRQDQLTNSTRIAADAWERERKGIALVDLTMEQLEKESARLRATMATTKPNTAEWRKYRAELDAVEKRQATLNTGMGAFGRAWAGIKTQVMGAVGVLGAMFAGSALFTGLQNWVKGSGKLSDELANIQKATGKTAEEVKSLNSAFGDLNTRTANSELRAIAVGLGQAGEEVSAAAVGAIDKINVALGDEFGEGAKEITGTLSVLRNNLSDIKSGDYGTDVMNIGNALNVLGANGLATAPVVSDIANRVAGVARTFNIASGDILGLAASFQELGINQERGSTAYIKILQRMAAEPDKFRKVVKAAGLDVAKFNSDLENDMQAAFITVAKAAKEAGTTNTAFGRILKDLDADGAGVSELMSKIGANQQLLADKSKLATEALKSQDSIIAEFNTKNNTLGANLEKIGKAMAGAFVNSAVVEGINSVARGLANMVSPAVSAGLEKERQSMMALHYQVLQTNEGSTARTKLIQQLQSMYPEYLGNLDAETVSNDELSESMKKVNRQMINKIALQQEQEKIDALQEEAGSRGADFVKAEMATLDLMASLEQKYGVAVQEAGSTYEQAANFRMAVINKLKGSGPGELKKYILSDERVLVDLINELGGLKGAFDVKTKLVESAMENKARMEALLNKQSGTDALLGTPAPEGETDEQKAAREKAIRDAAAMSEEQIKEAEKAAEAMAKLRDELQVIKAGILRDGLKADDQELSLLKVKYDKLRIEILANENHSAEDIKLLDELYANERANLIEEQGKKRIDAAKEVADKLHKVEQDAHDQVYMDQQTAEDKEVVAKMQEFDTLIALYQKAGMDTANVVKRTEAMIAAIRARYRKEEKLKAEEDAKEKRARDQQTAMAVAGALGTVNGVLGAFYNSANQMAYEQTVAAKMLGLLQIGISSAVGVAKAIEAGAGLTWPANLGAIASGVAAVLAGIAQAKALFNQVGTAQNPDQSNAPASFNVVPLGKKGGMVRKGYFGGAEGGVLEGPSHNDGGLGVYNEQTGKKVAEFEGGEAYMLLSKKFTDMNRDQLGKLLEASRSGRRLNIASGKGPLPQPNPQRVSDAMMPAYALGGIHYRGTALVNQAGPGDTQGGGTAGYKFRKGAGMHDEGPGGDHTPAWAAAMLGKMDQMVKATQADRRVLFSIKDYQRKVTEYETIQDRNSVKRRS